MSRSPRSAASPEAFEGFRQRAYISRRGVILRAWIRGTIFLAAALEGLAESAAGLQTAITGPPGRGFSSFRPIGPLIGLAFRQGRVRFVRPDGLTLDRNMEMRLTLPPSPELRDEGAIEAASEIVVARNAVLSATLARASLQPRPDSETGLAPVAGELYLRIRKPASVDVRRRDVPANPFAASPIRSAAYPQFAPRVQR
jgi:hypothetical protein